MSVASRSNELAYILHAIRMTDITSYLYSAFIHKLMISIKQQSRSIQQDQAPLNGRLPKTTADPSNGGFDVLFDALTGSGVSNGTDFGEGEVLVNEEVGGNGQPVGDARAATFAAGVVPVAAMLASSGSEGLHSGGSGLGISLISKFIPRDSAAVSGEVFDSADTRVDASRAVPEASSVGIGSENISLGFAKPWNNADRQDSLGVGSQSSVSLPAAAAHQAGLNHLNSRVVGEGDLERGAGGLGAILSDAKLAGLTQQVNNGVGSGSGSGGGSFGVSDVDTSGLAKAYREGGGKEGSISLEDSAGRGLTINSLSGEFLKNELSLGGLDSAISNLPTRNESQIGSTISWLVSQKGGAVSLDLTPPDVGQLRMELRFDSLSDQATLIIQASTESAKAAIEQSLDKLRQAFGTSGLELSVSVQTGSGGWSGQSSNSGFPQPLSQSIEARTSSQGPGEGAQLPQSARKVSSELSLYV